MSRRRTVGTRSQLYPHFIGSWLSEAQHAKLQALAQAHGWTKAQAVRELVAVFEVRPMVLTATMTLPEPQQDVGA